MKKTPIFGRNKVLLIKLISLSALITDTEGNITAQK